MKFGEKLKSARTAAGLSQQELADRIYVSRSAVAKWEAGNGMPDIENLKALARMFGVTLDEMMDESTILCTIRETIDLNRYTVAGKCRDAYDAAVLDHYPDAYRIDVVFLRHDFEKLGRVLNTLSFGLAESTWQLTHLSDCRKHYYLVDTVDQHILVCVTDESLTSSILPRRLLRSERTDTFCHDGYTYTNSCYNLMCTDNSEEK